MNKAKGNYMTYDKKCLQLAISFLSDHDYALTITRRNELADLLAQEIQRTIEDFIAGRGLET